MDNHKPISVRMNGKETAFHSTNKKDNDPWSTSYKEQAAAVENSFNPEDLIEYEKTERSDEDNDVWYVEKPKKKKKNKIPQVFKVFLFAAVTATVVGVTLGFIMLKMFAGIDGNEANHAIGVPSQATATGTDEEQNGEPVTDAGGSQTFTSSGLEAYVIQAGAFSSEAKAEEWSQQFTAAGFPSMVWGNAEDFRLFVGLSDTEQAAEPLLTAMEAEGLEFYLRPWTTESVTVAGSSDLEEWLVNLVDYWNSTVAAVASGSDLSSVQENWEQLVANFPESEGEKAEALHQAGQQFVTSLQEGESTKQLQINMLQVWEQYKNLGQ